MESNHFIHTLFTKHELDALVDKRAGETKLGEKVTLYSSNDESWKSCKFHVLGVMESIGPRLNKGLGGAEKGFPPFISRFVNVQSNEFLTGDSICLHGTIHLEAPIEFISSVHIEELDELISNWTESIVAAGGIPVLIGGGHNNALGLINGVSKALNKPISVVNLDPHADIRTTEERHSGNSFSTAYESGTMDQYYVLGLHQSYNNQFIIDQLKAMNAQVSWFENWIDDAALFASDVKTTFESVKSASFGLELDMDSIASMPSSAFTPSGVTIEQARFYIRQFAQSENACYLHLPEAAPSSRYEDKLVGKTLAYLVTDFIKRRSNV